MAKGDRPVKIKRYGDIREKNIKRAGKAKRIFGFLALLLVLFAIGFLGTKAISAIVKNRGASSAVSSDTQSDIDESSSNTGEDSSSQPEDSNGENVVTPTGKTRIYHYVNSQSLTSDAGIDGAITAAKNAGANCLVFDLKNSDGYLLYRSANQYGSQLVSPDTVIDIKAVVKKCSENGITPVARIYTFEDKMISTIERSTAVMYQGTDTRWLDNSAALGGKAWANPASTVMQQYIVDITEEIMSLGVKEIIFAGFQTPTGYSLDKRDFGTTNDRVLANMKSLIVTLQSRVSAQGGYSTWQINWRAVTGGDYRQYIVHPYQLGIHDFVITATTEEISGENGISPLKTARNNDEINTVALWVTNGTGGEGSELGNYFV